jgi:hypothetical protein
MVLGVIVIAVQVDVQQRQRQVADEEDDTGDNSGEPVHVAGVYRMLSQACSAATHGVGNPISRTALAFNGPPDTSEPTRVGRPGEAGSPSASGSELGVHRSRCARFLRGGASRLGQPLAVRHHAGET